MRDEQLASMEQAAFKRRAKDIQNVGIKRMFTEGIGTGEIGRALGLSPTTVMKRLKLMGVVRCEK